MKKNIIALAVAAALIAPAAAMADTTLYGKFHVSYDILGGAKGTAHNPATGLNTPISQRSGFSSNSSRIGIKGKEKIYDNLSVIYQWETTVNMGQNGSLGGPTGGLTGQRNTFIGATGNWGTVITGRHDTPFKLMGRDYDLFADTVGDSRNIISGKDGLWDLRPSQVLAYATPDLMGFNAMLAYVNSWAVGTTGPVATTPSPYNVAARAYSMSAGYKIAGFGLDAAYEYHRQGGLVNAAVGEQRSQSSYRLGANYTIAGFKILGLYQDIKNVAFSNTTEKLYGLGGAYSFGASTVKAQYYKANATSDANSQNGGNLWAVGYDYKLSKQTNVYAMYAQTSNSANGTYTIMGGGHDNSFIPAGSTLKPGGKSSAVSVGVEHKF
ncbi:MAG: porin [Halothiobacillus sp.]